jgi:hypothetical protein
MKIKKKIYMEIDIDKNDKKQCGEECGWFANTDGCGLFYNDLEVFKNESGIVCGYRCKKCIKEFGE